MNLDISLRWRQDLFGAAAQKIDNFGQKIRKMQKISKLIYFQDFGAVVGIAKILVRGRKPVNFLVYNFYGAQWSGLATLRPIGPWPL